VKNLTEIRMNTAILSEITAHLRECGNDFTPPLGQRVDIDNYACKLADNAHCIEAWANDELIGLLAMYCSNSGKNVAFISSVSILPGWHGHGIASELIKLSIMHAHSLSLKRVELEVDCNNAAAIHLYEKHGFIIINTNANARPLVMYLELQ
jgi:ribosomal protein S18 acetylase RimI-like enzyme